MVDFKYHVVSIVAVFLALAVGIVLGTNVLSGDVLKNLKTQTSQLRKEAQDLRAQNDGQQAQINADQAFAEAQKHGGDKLLEKDPTTPVVYVCDWNHNTNELSWHVIYGASRETAKLTVAVNASTGAFIRVEK